MAGPAEIRAMQRALQLAATAVEPTSPNPVVGAVILDTDGERIAEAVSEPRGGAHAEVVALRQAGAAADGATLVVTLEPCAARGRTPACTDAVVAAGIRRVVFAAGDPLPPFAGGARLLADAGVAVESAVLAAEAETGLGRWLAAARAARPFVTWKVAATLDGRAAAADGTSRWITGEPARREVHVMRARHDAVVVGVGTVLADDPQLTVRDADGPQPLRVVLDSDGRTPESARVRDTAAPTLVLTRADVPGHRDGGLDPAGVLKLLFDRGVRSVLLEGGPRVAGSFLAAGVVDRVVAYFAPLLLGAGAPALGEAGIGTLAGGVRLAVRDVRPVGPDVRITAEVTG